MVLSSDTIPLYYGTIAVLFGKGRKKRHYDIINNNESLSVFDVEWKREGEENASDQCC